MAENIIYDLLDEAIVEKLLRKNLKKPVKLLEIKPIKKNIWHTTYHVVFRYTVELAGQIKQIFVTAHDSESRSATISSLIFLRQHGFGQGAFLVPEPLFYEDYYKAAFYIGLEGENIYHFIREDDKDEVRRLVVKAAGWFAAFHRLQLSNELALNEKNSHILSVAPGMKTVLSAIATDYPNWLGLYERFYDYFIGTEEAFLDKKELCLVHGDAHPENVIRINETQLGVIDFVDMTLGDFARDLGTFSQQLDYMIGRKIKNNPFAAEAKQLFLTSYLKDAKISLDDNLLERINLYYNWTAIRTATFFLMKHEAEPDRAESLIKEVSKNLNIKK
jgi:hypothetical protein